MMRKKIHCIESQKEGFDDIPMKEVKEMIGYYEPERQNVGGKLVWRVTMIDESEFFSAKDQESAQIIAGQEEIKAMMIWKWR